MPFNNINSCQRLSCLNNPWPIYFLSRSQLMLPCCIWIEMTLTFNTQIYLQSNFFFKKICSIALQTFSFHVHRFDFKQAIEPKLSIRSKPDLHMLFIWINLLMYDVLILHSLRFSLSKFIHLFNYNLFQPSFIINRHFNG